MADRDLPTGRVQRLARLGRTAAGAAVRQAGTRTANVVHSDERSQAALERRQVETAKRVLRHQAINVEHLIGRRLELLTLAVLGQLGAANNWHRIAREWIDDDPPITELSRQEAEWLGLPLG